MTTLPDGDLVVGGAFADLASQRLSAIARFDGYRWHSLAGGLGGQPRSLLPMPDGGLLVGGFLVSATSSSGQILPISAIARWDGQSWSTLGSGLQLPGSNPSVLAMVGSSGGEVVVAGRFSIAGNQPAGNIARWDGSQWLPLGTGTNGTILALARLDNGDLIAGGEFSSAGDRPARYLARWDGLTWSEFGGTDNNVNALLLRSNGDLVVGGPFRSVGSVSANPAALWDGTSWHALGTFTTALGIGTVNALCETESGQLVACGKFPPESGGNVSIASWDGSNWVRFGTANATGLFPNPTLNKVVAGPGGRIHIGGDFNGIAGVTTRSLATWHNGEWGPVAAGPTSTVYEMLPQIDDTIISSGSVPVNSPTGSASVMRWNGFEWSLLGDGLPYLATALAQTPDGLGIAAASRDGRVSVWDGQQWLPLPGSFFRRSGAVDLNSMTYLPDGRLVVGGEFESVGLTSASCIAVWNGSTWSDMGAGLDNRVAAVRVSPDGTLYAAGWFMYSGSTRVSRVARWDGASWQPLGIGLDGMVEAAAISPEGDLIVGGSFTSAGGVPTGGLARWNGASWGPAAPSAPTGVLALAVAPTGDIYTAPPLRRFDGSSWTRLGSGNSQPEAIALTRHGELILGGSPNGFDIPHLGFNRFSLEGTPWVARQPAPFEGLCGGLASFVVIPAAGYRDLSYLWRKDGVPLDLSDPRLTVDSSDVSHFDSPVHGTLRISRVTPADAGNYDCVVSSPCGEVVSASAALTVPAATCCPADFNHDHHVDADDLGDFITCYFAVPPCPLADFIADGQVNADDLASFITLYFSGC